MLNKKGNLSIEAIFYIIILLIMCIMLNSLLIKNTSINRNTRIPIYQGINVLRQSIIKYDRITMFKSNEIEFADHVRIKIDNKKIYETPGYMPYFENVEKPKFIKNHNKVILAFKYKKQDYKEIIFYDKTQ